LGCLLGFKCRDPCAEFCQLPSTLEHPPKHDAEEEEEQKAEYCAHKEIINATSTGGGFSTYRLGVT
jgi:hypothetical protein